AACRVSFEATAAFLAQDGNSAGLLRAVRFNSVETPHEFSVMVRARSGRGGLARAAGFVDAGGNTSRSRPVLTWLRAVITTICSTNKSDAVSAGRFGSLGLSRGFAILSTTIRRRGLKGAGT